MLSVSTTLFFAGLYFTQAQTTNSGTTNNRNAGANGNTPQVTCLNLDASSICGKDYIGFPVIGDRYTDVSDFNQKMKESFYNPEKVAQDFEFIFGCPSRTAQSSIPSLRYVMSFWCSNEVEMAIRAGCPVTSTVAPKGPVLCASTCQTAYTSTATILQNRNVCTDQSTDKVNNRTFVLNTMNYYCQMGKTSISTNGPNKYCTQGTTTEVQYCGKSFFL